MLKNIFYAITIAILGVAVTSVSAKEESKKNPIPFATSTYCQDQYQRCTARLSPYADVLQRQCYDAFRYCQAQGTFTIR